ncbi:phage virion morphogenesis protein [Limobrevibacterium gyesilva]|uniref:Uncharacterized protein n=1 Tax=Limobrevibacterium gyesilva TaxID=2991712 RepID=A0AA41YPF8_9PROT|nr:hypothetical protein [Limobrevibacterium gyesilva]MCW3477651.1 hypothetical protein [Limobrevibacterium gyesilva]
MRVGELAVLLARVDVRALALEAVRAQAAAMAEAVRTGLPVGALRESVGVVATADGAVVGSALAAAARREFGTAGAAPVPFLGPVAAQRGAELARAVGEAVAGVLGGV